MKEKIYVENKEGFIVNCNYKESLEDDRKGVYVIRRINGYGDRKKMYEKTLKKNADINIAARNQNDLYFKFHHNENTTYNITSDDVEKITTYYEHENIAYNLLMVEAKIKNYTNHFLDMDYEVKEVKTKQNLEDALNLYSVVCFIPEDVMLMNKKVFDVRTGLYFELGTINNPSKPKIHGINREFVIPKMGSVNYSFVSNKYNNIKIFIPIFGKTVSVLGQSIMPDNLDVLNRGDGLYITTIGVDEEIETMFIPESEFDKYGISTNRSAALTANGSIELLEAELKLKTLEKKEKELEEFEKERKDYWKKKEAEFKEKQKEWKHKEKIRSSKETSESNNATGSFFKMLSITIIAVVGFVGKLLNFF